MKKPSWFHKGDLTNDDVKNINAKLKEFSKKEIEKVFAMNMPITIAKDGYVVRVYKDGREEKIKKISP